MSEQLTAMRCQEFVEVVTDYLERQMSEARMLWTEEHLAACDACRAYLEQMTATIQALRGMAEKSVSEETMAMALEAFRAERPSGG